MKKRQICVVLTMRASYAKLKPILISIKDNPNLNLQLVLAASALLPKYGNLLPIIEKDGFKINEQIHMIVEGESLLTSAKSTGLGVIEFSSCFDRLKPDAVVVMGDRYEIMSAAIAASYMNIPLAHVQGGETTGNIDEKVRHAITKLSDLHFPSTRRSAERIIKMGENPERVFMTGCPSIDIAKEILNKPELDFDPFEKYRGVGHKKDLSSGYFIVMQHPVTTEFSLGFTQIKETLNAMNTLRLPVIWFWPNIDAGSDDISKGIRTFRETENPKHIYFLRNMEPQDFLRLLNASNGIIGNSSAGIREASFLGVPAINIGSRQLNRERGHNVIDIDYNSAEILRAIDQHCTGRKHSSDIYGDGHAGERIAEHLASAPLDYTKKLMI